MIFSAVPFYKPKRGGKSATGESAWVVIRRVAVEGGLRRGERVAHIAHAVQRVAVVCREVVRWMAQACRIARKRLFAFYPYVHHNGIVTRKRKRSQPNYVHQESGAE